MGRRCRHHRRGRVSDVPEASVREEGPLMQKKNPGGDGLLLAAAAGAAIYFFRDKLFPSTTPAAVPSQISETGPSLHHDHIIATDQPLATHAPIPPRITLMRGASAAAIAQAHLNQIRADAGPQVTNNSPIGPWTPGAVQLPGGCWRYGDTPVLVNCPPRTAPPPPRPPARGQCAPGYTMDSAGVCARTTDQVMLAQLNSTPYTPAAPVSWGGLSPSIIGVYVSTIGVQPGTQLAALLNLPANPSNGVMEQGSDGFNYLPVQGTYIRQGTATQLTRPTGPIGP